MISVDYRNTCDKILTMHKMTVFYSVQNGGDGSAYPKFMESEALCRFDQEHMSEGWGECCIGSLSFESDSPIRIVGKEIVTKESYFIDRYCDEYSSSRKKDGRAEFIAAFFPNGFPTFTVVAEESSKDYLYNKVFVGDRQVARVFRSRNKSGAAFERYLAEVTSRGSVP